MEQEAISPALTDNVLQRRSLHATLFLRHP
jgi:hypothetical protein